MKAVYRSIKPYWLYLILIGKKTVEVGKTFPKADDWNKEVFLHCSKDMKSFNRIPEEDREWMRKYIGKAACRFVCDRVYNITPHFDKPDFCNQYLCDWKWGEATACLSFTEINDYLKGKRGYGWHISDLVIYDEPKELSEFYRECERYVCDGCPCLYVENTPNCYETYCEIGGKISIKKPPQSWCYVEEGSER